MAEIRFVCTEYCPAYSATDLGTGRCRAHPEIFKRYKLKLNSLIRLVLLPSHQEVLCTVWPDTYNVLGMGPHGSGSEDSCGSMSLDITVSKGIRSWDDTHCQILEASGPKQASSYYLIPVHTRTAYDPYCIGALMNGLPICKGFSVNLRDFEMECLFTAPNCLSIVRPGSILLRNPPDSIQDIVNMRFVDSTSTDKKRNETPARSSWHSLKSHSKLALRGELIAGVLLTGPPGVGKTYSLRALEKMEFHGCEIFVHEIVLRDLLTSDNGIEELLGSLSATMQPKYRSVNSSKIPLVLVLIDEIDSLGLPEDESEMQHLIKYYLCRWMDLLHDNMGCLPCTTDIIKQVFVATTNRPSEVDPKLKVGSRLGKEINFLNSSIQDREKLLTSMLIPHIERLVSSDGGTGGADVRFSSEIDAIVRYLSPRLGGFAAADISLLVSEAMAIYRDSMGTSTIMDLSHLRNGFEQAHKHITPSCLRSNVLAVPELGYDDVIGHSHAKMCFQRILSYYEKEKSVIYQRFGLSSPGGILLHGPPGNSKTRLVLAAAHSHGLPVISLSSADVYSAFVGGAEAEIRRAFRIARQSQPCILFMDELDTLVANRSDAGAAGDISVESRVLSTLLNEMDGIDGPDNGIVVVGTSNRIDCIDAALLRKGRLNHLVEMGNPKYEEAMALLNYFAEKYKLKANTINELSSKIHSSYHTFFKPSTLSGADIRQWCQEAAMSNLRLVVSSEYMTIR